MTPPSYPSLEVRFSVAAFSGTTFALVDSGFEGHLSIPLSLVDSLPAPSFARPVQTASGEVVTVPDHIGTMELIDQPRVLAVPITALGDEFPIGLAAMNHVRITFDHGRQLIVEP
jgi:predicted aspartyl protease